MNTEPDLGGFTPVNEAHAIVSASITVQFQPLVNDANWPILRTAILETSKRLGFGVPQPYYSVSAFLDATRMTFSVNAPPVGTSEIAGVSIARMGEQDTVLDRIICAKDSVVIQTYTYVRWAAFRDLAARVLDGVYSAYPPFAALKIEYWDRFERGDPSAPCDSTKVIAANNPYLSPGAVSADDPWHSYMGKFEKVSNQIRRLINVKIDVGDFLSRDGQSRRAILVSTLAQDAVNAPGYEPMQVPVPLQETLSLAEDQHIRLKSLMKVLITPTAAARIGL